MKKQHPCVEEGKFFLGMMTSHTYVASDCTRTRHTYDDVCFAAMSNNDAV